ncbi:WhiB family transcriptional regulator [Actinokineospora sp. NBRC 105648]|uniref:WhiB family transcriptional regulator n=1 Tax=Actinokineospora sp. NBRC 105648 TaxID=3032206 RepID=UPI0024A32F41|nr:WhiB family transcriptional regulator [Actinokineospora sp. NBRC 105648]GLZ40188.1 hypothetical protein Acsp05_38120 [Actinokineospora sp. NBRC 105648]
MGAVNPDGFYEGLAVGLDGVELVPDGVLFEVVTRDGACMSLYRSGVEPEWSGREMTDRETAAVICGSCPVRRECLEVELRTSGAQTVGVWGALPAEDVRALHPVWCERRARRGTEGGGRA